MGGDNRATQLVIHTNTTENQLNDERKCFLET